MYPKVCLSGSQPHGLYLFFHVVVGQMKWNPRTFSWEGNDRALKDFDGSTPYARPALITQLSSLPDSSSPDSSRSRPRIVGNMVFDPVQMCWRSSLPPEEEEPDPFADFSDEDDDKDDEKGGTIRAVIRQPRQSVQSIHEQGFSTMGSADSLGRTPEPNSSASSGTLLESSSDDWEHSASLSLDGSLKLERISRTAQTRHKAQMKGWISTASDDDRRHLMDIRSVATRKYSS